MNNFHPLEVVDRGSETQLQVGENYSYLILRRVHTNFDRLLLASPSWDPYAMLLAKQRWIKLIYMYAVGR